MGQTVIGIFDNIGEAQAAVNELTRAGISQNNIDVADRSDAKVNSDNTTDTRRHEDTDSISAFFSSLFGGDDDTYSQYSEVASRSTTVTVHAQSREEATRAAEILDDHGAVDVDERASQYRSNTDFGTGAGLAGAGAVGSGVVGSGLADAASGVADRATDAVRGQGDTIKIIEENMEVGKREVETGGVRVRSRIVERPVEEHLRLREEHVWVERNPVNRPATDADLASFKEGSIEITEHAEVPVVNKEARVVEEINIGKEVDERDELVKGTVRKTDVDIENITGENDDIRPDNLNRPTGL